MTTKDAPSSPRDAEEQPLSSTTLQGFDDPTLNSGPPHDLTRELYAGEPTVIVPPDEMHELASGPAMVDTPPAGEQVQTLRTRPARRRSLGRELLIGAAVVALCLGSFAVGFRLLNLTLGARAAASNAQTNVEEPGAEPARVARTEPVAAEIGTALLPGPEAPDVPGRPANVKANGASARATAPSPAGTAAEPSSAARGTNLAAQIRALRPGTTPAPPGSGDTPASPNASNVLDTPLRPPAD